MTAPTLLPTQAQAETFAGVTYHIDGRTRAGAFGRRRRDAGLFRAPHPSLEEPDDHHRHEIAGGRLQADDGRHADLRHRGVGGRHHRLQPRRSRPHRADPSEAGRGDPRARAPVSRRDRQRRLHIRARARRGQDAVRRSGLLHRPLSRAPRRAGSSGCTATATCSRKTLRRDEQIDVEPGGWLYKDTHVRMETRAQTAVERHLRRLQHVHEPLHRAREESPSSRCTFTT